MSSVLVVGGAGGIGSSVIEVLQSRGTSVFSTVLDDKEGETLRARFGSDLPIEIVDLADPESARSKLFALCAQHPDMGGVIVCAGVAWFGPVETTPLEVYTRMLQINAVSTVAIYQATLPTLRRNAGRLVLISTIAGRVPMPFMPAYSASKFAQEALCDNMRREAGEQGVHVSIITPAGGIKTNMVQKQVDGIWADFDTLGPEDQERYRYLYDGYSKFSGRSLAHTAYPPEEVTKVVFEAYDAAEPKPRYLAGDGDIITLMTSMTDRQRDACFATMFREGSTFTSDRIRAFIKEQQGSNESAAGTA